MVLGIAGSFASGKGTVVDYLVQRKGFSHFSASGFITEEIEHRSLPLHRDSMIFVANDLRQKNGPTFIIDSLFERAGKVDGNVIIESLRAVAEVKRIQELGGIVLGVDADSALRYERAIGRNSAKDSVTYEQWKAQELAESNPNDETKQNIFGALALADYTIMNNGTIEDLEVAVEQFLRQFDIV
jgi:dephospho-CoA kinase